MKNYVKPTFQVVEFLADNAVASCVTDVIDVTTTTAFTKDQTINCFKETSETVFNAAVGCSKYASFMVQWTGETGRYRAGAAINELRTAAGITRGNTAPNDGGYVTLTNGSYYIIWYDSADYGGRIHAGPVATTTISTDIFGNSY